MSQAVMQEVNMDVFARRIAPYFSWLESRIESGWTQSEHITKDVLKETKMLSTNMRARFILGVGRDDFVQEVQRALELFELAADAFPDECDEIESKADSLVKGISEELGPQFLPGQTSIVVEKPKVQAPKVEEAAKVEKPVEVSVQMVEKPKIVKTEPKVEKPKVDKIKPKVEKVKPKVGKVAVKKQAKKSVKSEKPKIAKPKVEKKEFKMPKIKMPSLPKLPKVGLPDVKIPSLPKVKFSKKGIKNFGPVKWVREFIFGED